jgi:hypothetical protein
MPSVRRWSVIVIVCALCLAATSGCRARETGPAGTGSTLADKAFNALQPRTGEVIFSTNPLDATPTVWERVNSLAESDPTLKTTSGRLEGGGGGISFTFSDGSQLALKPGPDGATLGSVGITRP